MEHWAFGTITVHGWADARWFLRNREPRVIYCALRVYLRQPQPADWTWIGPTCKRNIIRLSFFFFLETGKKRTSRYAVSPASSPASQQTTPSPDERSLGYHAFGARLRRVTLGQRWGWTRRRRKIKRGAKSKQNKGFQSRHFKSSPSFPLVHDTSIISRPHAVSSG